MARRQVVAGVALVACVGSAAAADGVVAYADEVIQYDPGFGGRAPSKSRDPQLAVGRPGGRYRDVSLGRGGLLELAFVTHAITNSGTSQPDLLIHETGPDVESVYVALQPADAQTAAAIGFRCRDERKPTGDGFCEIGRTGGGTTGLDVDAVFPGFPKGSLRFNAVQLLDDPDQGDTRGGTPGADIDGVTALFPGAAPHTAWPTFAPAGGHAVPLPAVTPLALPAMNIPVVHAATPAVPRADAPQSPRVGVVPRPLP